MILQVPTIEELKKMNARELDDLAREIRRFLIEKTNEHGGHLAANLGAVELTMALYRVFDFPKDQLIFDVGHQSYTHKILSGRAKDFSTLRTFGGLSGFPKIKESPYDSFGTGHSSTSISAALGLCYARDLKKEDHKVIAVIGDGSMTGGEAFEGINNASTYKNNLIIILNDNEMSIDRNVGGLTKCFSEMRAGESYNELKKNLQKTLSRNKAGRRILKSLGNTKDSLKEWILPEGMVFENMGIKYFGPLDGHDIHSMEKVLRRAKGLDRAVLIHVVTQKGRGYKKAELYPERYHGVKPGFLEEDQTSASAPRDVLYTDIFGQFMEKCGEESPDVVGVTAAMGPNVGFSAFAKKYPERFFDVGIAEQHAVTFSAGLAKGGLHPYVAMFSSFLQRGFDQVIHDICIQDLPVTILLDRAGIVPGDGETHQGSFDMAYLSLIPGLTVIAPRDGSELKASLEFSRHFPHPLAIRYPKEKAVFSDVRSFEYGKAEILSEGDDFCLCAIGTEVNYAWEIVQVLSERNIHPTLVNIRFVKPLDEALLLSLARRFPKFITMEDGILTGGVGEQIFSLIARHGIPVEGKSFGIPDRYLPSGDRASLRKLCGMDTGTLIAEIGEFLKK